MSIKPALRVALVFATAGALAAQTVHRRYLFLDPAFIEKSDNVTVRTNPAERREVVIFPDKPWEKHMISFFLTVRDENGKVRMWYTCRDDYGAPGSEANLAYAESTDGVTWKKPSLGIYDYKGSSDNNLVGLQTVEGIVFQDPNMPPEERYTFVSSAKPSKGGLQAGIYRFYSPDGLHWQHDAKPLIRAGSDTQNVVWWDEHRKEYVAMLRGWNPNPDRRKVVRLSLASLKAPSDIVPAKTGVGNYFHNEVKAPTILICDEQDPSRTDIYNIATQPYPLDPTWYVGFPTLLRRSEKTDAPGWTGRQMGPAEVQFVGSTDSVRWNRYDRVAYARPSMDSPNKKNMAFMGTGMVVRGNEIWQYGTEYESVHGDVEARRRKTDGAIVRYVQRVDGFVSLDTAVHEGTALTAPVEVTGNKLLLNLDTGALGEMRVALLDASGKAIAGFNASDCDYVEHNGTGVSITWAGKSDLSALKGRLVRLEFRSARTKLYSFRFE